MTAAPDHDGIEDDTEVYAQGVKVGGRRRQFFRTRLRRGWAQHTIHQLRECPDCCALVLDKQAQIWHEHWHAEAGH